MKYFRIPIDNYYEAVTHEKKPKYSGVFKQYTCVCHNTVAYVKGELKEGYYDILIQKDGVTEFTQQEYEEAINRLKN